MNEDLKPNWKRPNGAYDLNPTSWLPPKTSLEDSMKRIEILSELVAVYRRMEEAQDRIGELNPQFFKAELNRLKTFLEEAV